MVGVTELWLYRIIIPILTAIVGAIMLDYVFKVRSGDLFRRKDDCEKIANIFHKENREDHQKINDKLDKVGRTIASMEGELKRINGKSGNV